MSRSTISTMSLMWPKVSCVMLVCGRTEMTARAIRSFEAQTYENRELVQYENAGDRSIGSLRNAANAISDGEIICHLDSDDWSHSSRVAEQVTLLQSSGCDAVGYRDMLFWRETDRRSRLGPDAMEHDAWLFTGPFLRYALGTSLMYKRSVWEHRPFANESQGVEEKWCAELKVLSVTSLDSHPGWGTERDGFPRMIASIHGGNTSTGYDAEKHVAMGSQQWRRAPEWGDYCRERMAL